MSSFQHPSQMPFQQGEPSDRSPGSDDEDEVPKGNGAALNNPRTRPADPMFRPPHPSGRPVEHSLQVGPPPWGAPPSRKPRFAAQEEDEPIDPLKSAYAAAPWANMLYLAEAARLKADSHDANLPRDEGRKKRRLSTFVEESRVSLNERGNYGSPDPVDLGWCTLEKGRQLFDLLRNRSPFAITTIIAVAAKCEDAAGESDVPD
ncbi:uncharacterized protein IL334_001214 [Kwoniella shivajii]|uniref:Uncharacterized protein n=1 Tax=Kwoniella shivajii TaxID=564305 RepID=A0ABZ1CRA4_9TREE|nr:hypothetical protein IL334_001214 [Kwoniella shivajii]